MCVSAYAISCLFSSFLVKSWKCCFKTQIRAIAFAWRMTLILHIWKRPITIYMFSCVLFLHLALFYFTVCSTLAMNHYFKVFLSLCPGSGVDPWHRWVLSVHTHLHRLQHPPHTGASEGARRLPHHSQGTTAPQRWQTPGLHLLTLQLPKARSLPVSPANQRAGKAADTVSGWFLW